ncbi:MAG: V-type ATP synthase subunit A [Nitrososphaerota archaeon]|nr:V-type ATP synthase subunit A [Nitrososphaerota archaeon]
MGIIVKISGPVVEAEQMRDAKMYDVVRVGEEGLIGEVIRLSGPRVAIQVYEDTAGIKPGEKVENTGAPLSAELGPGLATSIFDGIQRPLPVIKERVGDIIKRGVSAEALDKKKKWKFVPVAKRGDRVTVGDVVGTVQETASTLHKVLVPQGVAGEIAEISDGSFTVEEPVYAVKGADGTKRLPMMQRWEVRRPRPYAQKLQPEKPLITGQRVIDAFFPIARGGSACIPGPFGSGKTVTQQSLAKWSDADVVVYVGCGERGNEMTEVLTTFPELEDPRNKRPLMERTVLIANTSNMPVAAREASIYTGITIAEYYRDMGYAVALMADSTSRWAEALREISGRLEEMPGEEGYPAYLGRRLAEFYERAGSVITLGREKKEGSVSVIGAVSPPGGDISEPVSQNTLRVTRAFWGLDASLASRRHFPSINWLTSYSLYKDVLAGWYAANVSTDFLEMQSKAMLILQQEAELQEIVQLVGPDALPERERAVLDAARMIREDFLQQSAFSEVDAFTSMKKERLMLRVILSFHDMELKAVESGIPLARVLSLEVRGRIGRMKEIPEDRAESEISSLLGDTEASFRSLAPEAQSDAAAGKGSP